MNREELLSLARDGVNVSDDSRKIQPGDIFIAVNGASENGDKYISQAVAAGCKYIACGKDTAESYAPLYPHAEFVPWPGSREAAWQLAAARFGSGGKIRVIGITGTNGKTTSASLLERLFQGNGFEAGVIGTINYRWRGFSMPAPLTTPGPLELHRLLREMADEKIEWAIMEASSHALAQLRVGGINFSGALFTNLTQDHLDFHKDMEAYFQAKAKLFLELPNKDKPCAINSDDAFGKRLALKVENPITYGLEAFDENKQHLSGEILQSDRNGLLLKMTFKGKSWQLKSSLVGKFNAMNLLGVQALGLGLGFGSEQFLCLENFTGVNGRLERIPNKQKLHIFVDYAHTPDALLNAQTALKNSGFKRLIVVFGCGGNRDRSKRPLMGAAVARLADIAVVTSDNPRCENPEAIIEDILPGMKDAKKYFVEADRKKATEKAISLLEPEDALLIAGKGHEDYQILGTEKIHYSDQEVVREFLR